MTRFVRTLLRRLGRDRRGSALIELAVAMPMMMIIVLGGVEVARYVLLNQKLDRVAVTSADLVAQAETLSQGEMNNIFSAVEHVIQPFQFSAEGLVIVTSVSTPEGGGAPTVNWQQASGGGISAVSQIGAPATAANLPQGFIVREGETVIVAEVFYGFTPLFAPHVTPAKQLYHRAMFRPRFGTLTELN